MSRCIAVLLTSNDTSKFAEAFPNDGEKIRVLLGSLRPNWTFPIWSVKDGEFPPQVTSADGYIITGSPASVHDPLAWITRLLAFIRDIHAAKVPLVGLCFGHQAIALALGGQVERSRRGWRVGIATTHISAIQPWMQPARGSLALYASHREQVTVPPPGARILGGDDFCPLASFALDEHIMTTEYHPEFTPAFMRGLVEELEDQIPSAVIERARTELAEPAQGDIFAQWMVRFLDQPQAR